MVSEIDDASHTLVCHALEWLVRIREWADKSEQRYVAPLYKAILTELLAKGMLDDTTGGNDYYVMACLRLWAAAPPPPYPLVHKTHYYRYLVNLEAISRKEPIPYPEYDDVTKPTHPLYVPSTPDGYCKGGICHYCRLGAQCMAKGSGDGACSSTDVKVQQRCEPDAALHFCNKHGCKFLLKRRFFDHRVPFEDGREVPHMGRLKQEAEANEKKYSYLGNRADRLDRLKNNEGLSKDIANLNENNSKVPHFLQWGRILGMITPPHTTSAKGLGRKRRRKEDL